MTMDSKPIPLSPPRRLALRLWHRLLIPGLPLRPTDAERLRGWARVLDWREASGGWERLRLASRPLLMPIRAWQETGRLVAKSGRAVEAATGVRASAQRRQVWWMTLRHRFRASSYLDFELYRPEHRRRTRDYLQVPEYFRVIRWLNLTQAPATDAQRIHDKRQFDVWCRTHGLPSIPTIAEYEDGALVAGAGPGQATPALTPCDLFSKPTDGTGGLGTAVWRYDGAGGWTGADGQSRTAEALLAELARFSQTQPKIYGRLSRRILLQPCLRNHRDLLRFVGGGGGLCTVRVVTVRPHGGRAELVLGLYKMTVGEAVADNFHFGNIIAPVDIATGRLGAGIWHRDGVLKPVERHPDSGAVIEGYRVPFWDGAVSIALRGLDAARLVTSLGWDIAITDDGPVVVEANTGSSPGSQSMTRSPLGDTRLPGIVEADVRRWMGLATP